MGWGGAGRARKWTDQSRAVNNIKWSNIHGSVAPVEVERERGRRNIIRENGWKFPRNNEGNQITDSNVSKNPKENTHTQMHTRQHTDTLRINWNLSTGSENRLISHRRTESSRPNNPISSSALSRSPMLRKILQKQRSKNCDSIYSKFKN